MLNYPMCEAMEHSLETRAMSCAIWLLLAVLLSGCTAAPTVQTDLQRMWDVNPCERCAT